MNQAKDYVLVKGNFTTQGKSYQSTYDDFSAGHLVLKGNLTQLSTDAHTSNLYTENNHQLILSGDKVQQVSLQSPANSSFATMILDNTSTEGVIFNAKIKVRHLFNHKGNRHTLHSSAEETDFPDYDKDGKRDHLDPYPLSAEDRNDRTAIASVTPLKMDMRQSQTFTVNGVNLPKTLYFSLKECTTEPLQDPNGSQSQHQFTCTHTGSPGYKRGIIQATPDGEILYDFIVTIPAPELIKVQEIPDLTSNITPVIIESEDSNEPEPTPTDPVDEFGNPNTNEDTEIPIITITSVTPLKAIIEQETQFTVTGQNLPDGLGFTVGDCEHSNIELSGGTNTQRTFICTPKGIIGNKVGLVKTKSGGEILYTFEVTVTAEASNEEQPTSPTEQVIDIPQALLDTEICTQQECTLDIDIDQAGFYVVSARLLDGNTEGFWGISFTTTGGINAGGFNSGATLKENGDAPGFMAFYLSEPETVSITPYEYTGNVKNLVVQISRQDETGERTLIFDQQTASGATHTTEVLQPGFYVAAAFSQAGDPRGQFGFSVNANSMLGGVNIGGWIDENGAGFGGLYIDSPQEVKVKALFGDSYGSSGAGYMQIDVYQQQSNGERVLYYSLDSSLF
jgi:hypothetical protein